MTIRQEASSVVESPGGGGMTHEAGPGPFIEGHSGAPGR